jgi:hypothetical protein
MTKGAIYEIGIACSRSIAAKGLERPPNACWFSTCSTPCLRIGSRRIPSSRTSPSSGHWKRSDLSVRVSWGTVFRAGKWRDNVLYALLRD